MKKITLTHFYVFCLLLASVSLLPGCSKSGSNPKPVDNTSGLNITSLSVSAGPYTTNVAITGTGFSSTVSEDHVFFNGVAATVQGANNTYIQTSVPLAAGTGPVTITVNGKTATGPTFTYQPTEVATLLAGGSNGSANGTGASASFSLTLGLATDASGNIYVADQENNLIRKVTPSGQVTTLAGSGKVGATDGLGTLASFSLPSSVATDASGNVYVAEKGNGLVRKITPAGMVSTITVDGRGKPMAYRNPFYVAVDNLGDVLFTDLAGTYIYEIPVNGTPFTAYYAGASSNGIYGMVVDKTGNIFTVDNTDDQIDKITSSSASVFAGSGILTGGALDGTGKAASFYEPYGLAIDGNGNLFVPDRGNGLIREITPAAVVTTFGGQDPVNFLGPLRFLSLGGLTGITIDASGNIYVAGQGVIRKISFQ